MPLRLLKAQGIRVATTFGDVPRLENLEPHLPMALGTRVHLEDDGCLVWPVLFVYPEHGQTDFVRHFRDDETFLTRLDEMFGPSTERPPWDKDDKYCVGSLKVYFEDEQCNLWEINPKYTLSKILQHPGYIVSGGTPSFLVLVDGSPFLEAFLKRYSTTVKKV